MQLVATCVVPGSSARWMAVESGRIGIGQDDRAYRLAQQLSAHLPLGDRIVLGGTGAVWATLARLMRAVGGPKPGWMVAGGLALERDDLAGHRVARLSAPG